MRDKQYTQAELDALADAAASEPAFFEPVVLDQPSPRTRVEATRMFGFAGGAMWDRGDFADAADTDDALRERCAARSPGPCQCFACMNSLGPCTLLAPDLGGEG